MNAKKKSKKKKASQSKAAEDAASNAEETVEQVQNHHHPASEENPCFKTSGNVDVQSAAVSESDLESERHKIYQEKFALLNEILERLEEEKILRGQRETRLEERITDLQNDVHFCIQNDESLQEKLNNVQNESISLISREVSLKEKIDGVDKVVMDLLFQVTQLEKSRMMDIQENQRLVETISSLELRIQLLEKELSPSSELKFQGKSWSRDSRVEVKACDEQEVEVVAASSHIPPPQHGHEEQPPVSPAVAADHTSPKHRDINKRPDPPNEGIGIMTGDAIYSSFGAPMLPLGHLGEPDDPRRSEEIVQIPLDDTPVRGACPRPPVVATGEEKEAGLPLSDAPLIGAPFRLISFMARYVSGADLAIQAASRPAAR